MLCLVYEVEEYIITLTVFFFFLRKTSNKWRRGGRRPSLSLLFPGNGSLFFSKFRCTPTFSLSFIENNLFDGEQAAGRIKEKRPRKERWSVQQFMIVPIITFGVFLAGTVTAWCSLTHLWRITLCYVMEPSVIQKATVSVLLFCFPFLVISCLIAFVSIQQPFFYLFKFKKEPE